MALPVIFGTITATSGFLSLLDQNFNALGALVPVQCTCAGTNAYTLTPIANNPTVNAYANYQPFLFTASATSTGAVTLKFGSLAALNAYGPDGTTQLTTGNIVLGSMYIFYFNSALNGGLGGFTLMSSTPSSSVSFPITVGQGGTGQTTALAARGSSGLNIDQLTSTSFNADSSIAATTRVVASSSTAMTAGHTLTLPAASALNPGQQLWVCDLNGVVGSFSLTVQRAGADTVNGGTSVVMNTANSAIVFISDGVSKWSAEVITVSGSGAIATPNQFFTSSQTVTIPSGATKCKITLIGGGGGAASSMSGAGAGGTLRKFLSGLTPGNTLSLTVGAAGSSAGGNGGATSLASGTQTITTLTANGGTGSTAGSTAGGTTTNGDADSHTGSRGGGVAATFAVGGATEYGYSFIGSGFNTAGTLGVVGFGCGAGSDGSAGVAGGPGLALFWWYP